MKIEDHLDNYDEESDEDRTYGDKTCNRCGLGNLHWEDDNGKWILVTAKGQIHKCKPKPLDLDQVI